MHLLVAAHLQAVLDPAQEAIGGQQRGGHVGVEVPRRGRRRQRRPQRRHPQRRLAAAAHQLHQLHDELDLADAAGTELDVVGQLAPRDLGIDQALHLAQAVEGRVVEVAAEHEGLERLDQGRAHRAVAGHRVRLDPGVALPVAALALVVLLHRRQRQRQAPGAAEGAQAHVDAEGEAVGGDLAQHLDQALAQAQEIVLVGQPARAVALAGLAEGEDQVDVGGEVELASAQLAHADHGQALGRAVGPARRAQPLREAGLELRQRALDADLGQLGAVRERGFQRVQAGHVAQHQAQALVRAPAPQRLRGLRVVGQRPLRGKARAGAARVGGGARVARPCGRIDQQALVDEVADQHGAGKLVAEGAVRRRAARLRAALVEPRHAAGDEVGEHGRQGGARQGRRHGPIVAEPAALAHRAAGAARARADCGSVRISSGRSVRCQVPPNTIGVVLHAVGQRRVDGSTASAVD